MLTLQAPGSPVSVCAEIDGRLTLKAEGWPGMLVGPLAARLKVDGSWLEAAARGHEASDAGAGLVVRTEMTSPRLSLVQHFEAVPGGVHLRSELCNEAGRAVVLNQVELLSTVPGNGQARFGESPSGVRLYEQGGYWARVRSAGATPQHRSASGEEDGTQQASHASRFVWVAYDAACRMALLVGFETSERWLGRIVTEGRPGEHPAVWSVCFDGGDLLVEPGERLALEDVVLLCGPDPLALLATYGDRVAARHGVAVLPRSPVSCCSWYPYRLGVTEERVLANVRIAAERLKPLGLSIMELDLGWERDYLPSAFEENDQFPHGLAWLAGRLADLGFALGAWKGPFTVSALDPLAREHAEWLARGEDGRPVGLGPWFWEPHRETHALDLSHPGAQNWLREKVRSLAERGVRYLKPDFIGMAMTDHLKRRDDPHIVAGAGCEAIRIGMSILMEEMRAGSPDALVLNCGGPDMPGTGAFPLLYTCNDTGNTGYVGWRHLRDDYGQAVAGHLWKNRRWGIVQPSCMVVGLPGTLEEARVRATATFLSGGQVDIGDDLTSLPEDRWQVLLSTLPPLGDPALPLDLFEPFEVTSLDYESSTRGQVADRTAATPAQVSQVWKLPVDGGWDRWDLLGLFNYATNDDVEYGKASIVRFRLPLERLGIAPDARLWAFEFWSGQFLGASPFTYENPRGYTHPGDAQSLISSPEPGVWEVSFFGPGVKLLALRPARPHPWPVGTCFHQSGGAELADVAWDGRTLRGVLKRPEGQEGYLVIAGAQTEPTGALVNGEDVRTRRGANGSVVLPVVTRADATEWEVRFG